MRAVFDNLCPNCGGEITSDRLKKGLPCEKCLPEEVQGEFEEKVERVWERLTEKGEYRTVHSVVTSAKEFREFFEMCVGAPPWSVQKGWFKKVAMGFSFSLIAPTGVGKTTFGQVLALYLSKKGKKTYFILPTTTLVEQVSARLRTMNENSNTGARIVSVHSKMSAGKKREAIERIERGDLDVLVTTAQFLSRNFDMVRGTHFDLLFVDDVDAVLKSSKNVDRILMLAGFEAEVIERAYEVVRMKFTAAVRRDRALMERALELERKIEGERKGKGQVIVASATGRARGARVKLFRELLGFEIGSTRANLRNVVNMFAPFDEESIVETVVRLGEGGIVFVPVDRGANYGERLVEALRKKGVKCALATSQNASKVLKEFERGDLDVLVGVATYYGVLVRGIDLPERIKYTVFAGVPKFSFSFDLEDLPDERVAFLVDAVAEVRDDVNLKGLATRIRRYRRQEDIERGRAVVAGALGEPATLEELKKRGIIVIEGNRVLIADGRTYVQATGRTSRMYPGGVTKGLSVLFVDNEGVFAQLRRFMSILYDEHFEEYSPERAEEVMREIREERARVKEGKRVDDPVKTVLFIVESPNKARTIARFFGRPSVYRKGDVRGYEVTTGKYVLTVVATRGHVTDLVTDRGYHGVIVDGFVPVYTTIKTCPECGAQVAAPTCPRCGKETKDDGKWRINALRTFALEADEVLVGTDPDTEGEKIAWDVTVALTPYVQRVRRVEFHEVTRRAVMEAIETSREVDERRVEAQAVRRVEDRWIGFELSRKLWEHFGMKNLSAGRVQTPVLGWVIDRYEEHTKSVSNFVSVETDAGRFLFEGKKEDAGETVTVLLENVREEEVSPPPPFTTDALIKEAGNRMGAGAREVMALAQDLFEAGLITYHRTDSTRVSSAGISVAREYVVEHYGEEYFEPRTWGEGGAHECIRPTRALDPQTLIRYLREGIITHEGLTSRHIRLYAIIFDRFMRSQMKKARVKKADVKVVCGALEAVDERTVEVLFPGWMKGTYFERASVHAGSFPVKNIRAFKMAKVPLYTQADLVGEMKERRIGRPSTYATIVQRLLERKYVLESKEKRKLYPTDLGRKVFSFLSERFPALISEERTRELEEKMDLIEEGKADYVEVMEEVYGEIRKSVGGA